MSKKIFLGLIVFALVIGLSSSLMAADLYFDGRRVRPEVKPLEIDGRIFVPLEEVTDYFNISLNWNVTGKQVRGRVAGNNFVIDRPIIVHGYLMVSLEFLEDHLGLNTNWDQRRGIIDIERGEPSPPARDARGLLVIIDTDRSSYKYGDYIAVSMLIFNKSDRSVELEFSTGQTHDLVLRRGGRVVWQWSHDKAFTQAFQTKRMEPYEAWLETFLIPTNQIRTFVTGNYTLEGKLTIHNREVSSEEITINISR